jgi:hypothetical protein
MAEHAAVNRRVAGSSPARGASKGLMRMRQSLFFISLTGRVNSEEDFSQGAKEQRRWFYLAGTSQCIPINKSPCSIAFAL